MDKGGGFFYEGDSFMKGISMGGISMGGFVWGEFLWGISMGNFYGGGIFYGRGFFYVGARDLIYANAKNMH